MRSSYYKKYFYPRSPCGERQLIKGFCSSGIKFLSTLSLRRATGQPRCDFVGQCISIHALLAESDDTWARGSRVTYIISIHALLAESDKISESRCKQTSYFYPRSPCGERRWLRCWQLAARDISIHALLAESDDDFEPSTTRRFTFLSTLSLRRATISQPNGCTTVPFLSTLSLRRATRRKTTDMRQRRIFLSTLSLRRATYGATPGAGKTVISIHALLAESDPK